MNGSPRQTVWFGTLSFLLLLGLFARTLPVATEAAQQVEPVRVIPVQGNVYMLQFSNTLGNIGVLPGPDGVLLIDDQVPGMTNNVLRGVREITDEEIRFVINTHVHMDHFGGNPILADMGATIISHKNVRDRMFQPHHTPRRGGTYAGAPIAEANRPILTFEDAMNFHMNGEDVRVWLVPRAHTDGDAFTYFATSDVLHTGDVFRTNMYPIIDVFNGGSLAGTIAATETAIALAGPNTKVIPGHGDGFTDRDGLIEVLDMMVDIRDTIQEMIVSGMHLEEVLAARPTAEYDEQWGQVATWNAKDVVPIIYNELGGGPTLPLGGN